MFMELYPHIEPYLKDIEERMATRLDAEDKRVYGMITPFIRRGGKRIRPALCLLSCGSCGGKYESALEAAAIIELFHNFTLIHDDVEDDSKFRRGAPTLHVVYGIPIALNSGDALYTLLWRWLIGLKQPKSRLIALEKLYVDSFKRVVDGQGLELDWIREKRFDVSEEDYLGMISGKTSALMGLSCEVGSMLAGGGKRDMAALRRYGERIGAAFQIHDDVLNVTGDFSKYQKEIGGDITEGKRTLMVVHCLQKGSETDRTRLKSILLSHTSDKAELEEAIEILRRCGSIDFARAESKKLINEAKEAIKRFPGSPDKESLERIADYCISREK